MFRSYSQQDSQEFLRYFLDELHNELRQPLEQTALAKAGEWGGGRWGGGCGRDGQIGGGFGGEG